MPEADLSLLYKKNGIRHSSFMSDYKLRPTMDGTFSVESSEYGQAMHSSSGAYEEALHKHVIPSGILEKLKRGDTAAALDIGFGIGYNSLALINAAAVLNLNKKISILGLEKDKGYLPLMKQINFGDTRDEIYHSIINSFEDRESAADFFDLKILFGDARQRVDLLNGLKFDAVFHDPYSPAKNPELWTSDFFKKICALMKPDAVLTTYSSALQIRGALDEAKFFIGKGPSVGPKREGTIASPSACIQRLDEDEFRLILADPKSAPYRDPEFDLPREIIIKNRSDEILARRLFLNS